MTWRPEFKKPARAGAWVEKGSCGHVIAKSYREGVTPTEYTKPELCEACKRAQGEGKSA